MPYFNYHAKIKKLILNGQLERYQFFDKPALVLYFKNNPPMPIRSYRWEEYIPYLMMLSEKIDDKK